MKKIMLMSVLLAGACAFGEFEGVVTSGEYVPGLRQTISPRSDRQSLASKEGTAEKRRSPALGTILADIDREGPYEVKNEVTGALDRWDEFDAVTYEGEIFIEADKQYNFFHCIDEGATIEIDGEKLDLTRVNQYLRITSKKFAETRWYPLRIELWDNGGRRGAVSRDSGFKGMGFGWNTNGCMRVNASTKDLWSPLRDDGTGRFLHSSVVPRRPALLRRPVSGAACPCSQRGTYAVIDISGGATAERYPVSYLDQVPAGGWTDAFKTSKIVLRRVDPGTYDTMQGHKVKFTHPFYIGVFELTQKQIKLITGDENRKFVFPGDMRPADCLTWDEMRGKNAEFDYPNTRAVAKDSVIGRLRAKTGLAGIDLPTSYQFGCAWNAGTDGEGRDLSQTGRHSSNQDDGKGGISCKHTLVGSYEPNAWGIYDLHGNVWEMCVDRGGWNDGVETDPLGSKEGERRKLLGGCWNSKEYFLFSDFVPEDKEANEQMGKTGCRIVINSDCPVCREQVRRPPPGRRNVLLGNGGMK